jgi:L-ascorbate metabolism protein UlaG (beta-lactamase superfamily)
LKLTGILILSLILLLSLSILLFTSLHPAFGGKAGKDDKIRYQKSPNHRKGIFQNQVETIMSMSFGETLKLIPEFLRKVPGRQPMGDIQVGKTDSLQIIKQLNGSPKITWFGHSTFLLTIDGKKILLDPMFGETPSPVPFLGSKRFSKTLPVQPEDLPDIDLVLFSHDHYDHLDYPSVIKLKDKVQMWYVPLGVGSHLKAWGVHENKISEFDWWETTDYKGLNLICTPARHFSGRGLTDRFSTLWSSWVIRTENTSIYFSGDSGYGPHFKEIGEKYGPFDLALMECGQYNELWSNIHMMPEETIQAGLDVKARKLMPIHWGAFTLAFHPWKEPVQRAYAEATRQNISFLTPEIGEITDIKNNTIPTKKWWDSIP